MFLVDSIQANQITAFRECCDEINNEYQNHLSPIRVSFLLFGIHAVQQALGLK